MRVTGIPRFGDTGGRIACGPRASSLTAGAAGADADVTGAGSADADRDRTAASAGADGEPVASGKAFPREITEGAAVVAAADVATGAGN